MYEYIPTGFPELDNRLGGLIRPSCIALNCESAAQVYPFLFRLILYFLKNGLKGAYVCLDISAEEVRLYAKRFGVDVENYEKNNRIYLIDFFTKKQKELVERKKVEAILYDSEYVFKKVSQFLDGIKTIENGFIVIDSITTLILNMGEKNTYKFVRTLKLLTRQFNLIALGIVYSHILDKRITDMVCSVSDMEIVFRRNIAYVDYIVGTDAKREVFVLSKDSNGIAIRPLLPEKVSGEDGLKVREIFSKTQFVSMKPIITLRPTVDVNIPSKKLVAVLDRLKEEGFLIARPHYSAIACPGCNSSEVEFYVKCPECDSILIEKDEAIEHFSCGHIDFRKNFEQESMLICPKCRKELRLPGVDYRKITPLYRCSNGHLFSFPTTFFVCLKCRERFDLEKANIITLYAYELTADGKAKIKSLK